MNYARVEIPPTLTLILTLTLTLTLNLNLMLQHLRQLSLLISRQPSCLRGIGERSIG